MVGMSLRSIITIQYQWKLYQSIAFEVLKFHAIIEQVAIILKYHSISHMVGANTRFFDEIRGFSTPVRLSREHGTQISPSIWDTRRSGDSVNVWRQSGDQDERLTVPRSHLKDIYSQHRSALISLPV